MMKNRKIVIMALLMIVTMTSISSIIFMARGDITIDAKIQLSDYYSFGADIVDSQVGYVDDDSNLDMVVAYADRVVIYEDSGNGFEHVDEIKIGDSGFIDSDSNVTKIAVGDVIGRPMIDEIDSISNVENSTGCAVNDPYPHDVSYLETESDGNYYNLTYATGGNANFSINLTIGYGLTVDSFDLKIVLRDWFADGVGETALLSIYDNVDAEWETWLNLDGQVVEIWTTKGLSTSSLSNPTGNYIDSNNLVKVKLLYDNSSDVVDVHIDFMDIVNISCPATNDIIVGGGAGELGFIHAENSASNDYTATQLLAFTDYGNGAVAAEKRTVSDIILADIDNLNKSNFIVSITGESTYVCHANKSVAKYYESSVELVITPVDNTITSLAAYDPIGNEANFTLCIGTRSGSYFRRVYDNNTQTFVSSTEVPVASPISTLEIADLTGSSVQEVVVGTLDGKIRIYNLETSTNIWDSQSMVSIGNNIISITKGDFVQDGKDLIAIGTSQDVHKIIVLEDPDNDNEFTEYWTSYVYLREALVCVGVIENPSGVDTLVSTNKRHIGMLSTVYTDTDGDELSDLGEIYFYRTYPDEADSDEDGLNDGVEIFYYLTDPVNPDSDGDFIPDGMEVAMGTDPLDPMSSIIIFILVPASIVLAAFAVIRTIRKSRKQKKAEYERVKNTPNLLPQVRRLIIQRLESYTKEFKGFQNKKELNSFKRNLTMEMMAIVLDRLYNFLEYLRLKGILFTDREEEMLKKIVDETMEPVVKKTDSMVKQLLMYETKYKQFNEQFLKLLDSFADWKKAMKRGTKVVEELIRCPKCETLQPKGSAFCLECGEKLV